MSRRTRSFVLDNTTGLMFVNTTALPSTLTSNDSAIGDAAGAQTIEDLNNVDLDVVPETMTMAVDFTGAGSGTNWEWSWKSGAIPYARSTISNSVQASVPLYESGSYTLYNFSAHSTTGSQTQTHKIHLKWLESAGTENLVSWSTETLNVQNITFEGVRGGAATEVQRLVINVPTPITVPTSFNDSNVTYNVAATTGAYVFSGAATGNNVSIGPLYRGHTYTFTLDSSVSGHPFYLTTDDGTNYVSNTYVDEYTSGVTGSRNDSGNVVFVVPSNAPDTLYYQCGVHSAMRGTINIKTPAVETNSSGNYVIYAQHDQEGHLTPVELRDKPAIAGQMTMVYDSANNKFVPQDLGDYLEKTNVFQEKIEEEIQDEITASLNNDTITNLTKVRDDIVHTTNLYQQGELAVTTGTVRWYAPFNLVVTETNAKVSTAADGAIGITVNKNGSSAQTFNISASATSGSGGSFTMSSGDYLTVDVTSVGTTNKGEDLVVQFKYKQQS